MEEAKLARVDVDAARDAQRTVARLQRQAEMLIGNIKKECLDRDTYDTLALVAEETENGLGLSLTSLAYPIKAHMGITRSERSAWMLRASCIGPSYPHSP